jgi:hypothetical protein
MKRKLYLGALFAALLCLLTSAGPVAAGGDYVLEDSLEKIMQGGEYRRHLTGAKYRLAVFSFEDPQNTGLGDDVALLLARHILFSNSEFAIGILNFKQGLAPGQPGDLSYFDKVDKVAQAEQVNLAVWGRVLPVGDRLMVDTFLQLPPKSLEQNFSFYFSMPKAMGGKKLQAHMRPDRIHVQRIFLDQLGMADLAGAAGRQRHLLQAPRADAPVMAEIPRDKTFTIASVEKNWVQLQVKGGVKGWMPRFGPEFLKVLNAAEFAGGVLTRGPEGANPELTPEALAVAEQFQVMEGRLFWDPDETLLMINRWVSPERQAGSEPETQMARGAGKAPGGAAFANLKALVLIVKGVRECSRAKMAEGFSREEVKKNLREALSHSLSEEEAARVSGRIAKLLDKAPARLTERELNDFFSKKVGRELDKLARREKGGNLYFVLQEAVVAPMLDSCKLDPGYVREIANELAKASLDDPDNLDVLKNLAVLFDYLGDTERRNLAETIAGQVAAKK